MIYCANSMIIDKICSEISKAGCFSIQIDGAKDYTKKEQLALIRDT